MAFSAWRTWVTGETVTATQMNQEIKDNGNALFPNTTTSVDWSPTLEATTTNPTGAVEGQQYRMGAMQFVAARFDISTPGSGIYFVTLPSAPAGLATSNVAFNGQAIGHWSFFNFSESGFNRSGVVQLATGGTVRFNIDLSTFVSHNLPIVIQNGDLFSFFAMYPAA